MHLCQTSFVWHNRFSVVALCLFLNFLNLFLITIRAFPEKEMSPIFYNIYQKYMDTILFFMLSVAFVIFRFFYNLATLGLSCSLWDTVP